MLKTPNKATKQGIQQVQSIIQCGAKTSKWKFSIVQKICKNYLNMFDYY